MKLRSLIIASLPAVALLTSGCGGEKTQEPAASPEVETAISSHDTGLNDAISTGDMRKAATIADSLALMVDDLTPAQTVNVLATFADVTAKAQAEHQSRKALETMRKYIDVYDIGFSINPNDLRKALKADSRHDYDSLATAYRSRLSDYAYTLNPEEPSAHKSETTDSVK